MSRSSNDHLHRNWLSMFGGPNRHADSQEGTYELVQQPQHYIRRKPAPAGHLSRLLHHTDDYQRLDNDSPAMKFQPVSGREVHSIPGSSQDYGSPVINQARRDAERPLLDQNTSYQGFVTSPPLKDSPYIGIREKETDQQGDEKYWNPFWLRAPSLVFLSGLFLVFVLATVVIWHFGRSRRGYPVENVDLRFLWTYGPTFVLVIVVALWREVEYFCKVLTPWQVLQKGQAPAHTSLTLDYVSPVPWKTVGRAVKHRHLAVVVSSIGFWILKLAVIASSGFLVLGPTLIVLPQIPVRQITRFFVGNYNATNSTYDIAERRAVYAYYGITQGVSLPAGTINDETVFAQFSTERAMPPNSTLTVETDIFSADFVCEAVEFDNVTASGAGYQLTFNYRSPRCQPQSYAMAILPPPSPIARSRIGDVSTVFGRVSLFDCNGGEADNTTPDDTNTELNWFILTFNGTLSIEVSSNDTFQIPDRPYGGYLISNFASSWRYESLAGVICAPSYSVSRARVAYNNSDIGLRNRYEVLSRTSSTLLPGLSQNDFTRGVYRAGSYSGPGQVDFLSVMSASVGALTLDRLHNDTALGDAASLAYKGLAAQYAISRFSASTSDRTDGIVELSQLRLYAGNVSTWIMLAAFVILFALATLLLWSRPWSVVLERPDSTFALAAILRRSPQLQNDLLGTGHMGSRAMTSRLSESLYSSTTTVIGEGNRTLRINVDRSSEISQPPPVRTQPKWHLPIVGRKATVIGILLLPLIFIAILEVLQQLSNQRNGFAALRTQGSTFVTREEVVRLASACVMLLVATAYTSLDFVVLKYTPFARLKKAQATTEDLKVHLLGSMPPVAIWRAFKFSYWGVLFSTSAALVGSLLTIVVSGLFIARDVEGVTSLQLTGLDSFTPVWTDSAVNDSQAARTLGLIERYNLSYSQFTYDELALPSVDPILPTEGAPSVGSRIAVQIPAWRAGLDCSIIPRQAVSFDETQSVNDLVLTVQTELPPQCQIGGPAGNLSTTFYNVTISARDTGSMLRGSMLTLHLGPYRERFQRPYGNDGLTDSSIWFDNPAGCPTLVFTFGALNMDDTATMADQFTTLVCSQQMEEVTTEVTFVYPAMSIDNDRPPVPDEGSRRLINVTSVLDNNVVTALPYRIQGNLDAQLPLVSPNQTTPYASQNSGLDGFFTMLLYGKDAVDPATMIGQQGETALVQSIQHLYRKYMAQAISMNMRVPTVDATNRPTYTASVRDYATSRRLFVVEGPKAALQGMLAFMFIAGALAYIFTPLQDVLMHNPTSIAGTMSMLAGSRLCDPRWHNSDNNTNTATTREDNNNDNDNDNNSRIYRLGWWGDAVDHDAGVSDFDNSGKRFGIDSIEGVVR